MINMKRHHYNNILFFIVSIAIFMTIMTVTIFYYEDFFSVPFSLNESPGSISVTNGVIAFTPTNDHYGLVKIGYDITDSIKKKHNDAYLMIKPSMDSSTLVYFPLKNSAVDISNKNIVNNIFSNVSFINGIANFNGKISPGPGSPGSGSYISMSLVSSKINNITMSAWFRTRAPGQPGQCIFYNGSELSGGYGMFVNNESQYGGNLMYLKGLVWWHDTGITISDTCWHFVVLSLDSDGTAYIYLDGVPAKEKFTGLPPLQPIAPVAETVIGRTNYPTTRYFNGSICDFIVYNKTLTSDEVLVKYKGSCAAGSITNSATGACIVKGTMCL
jgi:hypothetical protein